MFLAVFTLALQVALATLHAAAPATPAAPSFDHVLVVSIDGLRPDAIGTDAATPTPNLTRLLRGPGTLEARADPDLSITLPGHLDMLTSRFATGSDGHGWVENTDPPAIRHGGTLQKKSGRYVASMFDVAHDRGIATAVLVSKTKFWLLVQSYGESEGAKDTEGADNGRNKIDLFAYSRESREVAQQAAEWLRSRRDERTLSFVHFSDPDVAGHTSGWDMAAGSPYRKSVAAADAALGIVLAAIDSDERLRGRTAVILTSDHGGGVPFKTHTESHEPVNFRVPFMVWLGQDTQRLDLAALNAGVRAQPGPDEFVGMEANPQPLRAGEAGNLALSLLGLPAIPGSQLNAKQDLRLTPAPEKNP